MKQYFHVKRLIVIFPNVGKYQFNSDRQRTGRGSLNTQNGFKTPPVERVTEHSQFNVFLKPLSCGPEQR